MNHVFSLIWNPATQSYCPAPETARSRVKGRHRKLALALAIAAVASGAHGAPTGASVVDGSALISNNGADTVINQSSQAVTINWQDFDIAVDERVTFHQPDSSSLALNRVFSADGTQINGQLNANGRVFVLDANGVLFGQSAQVSVGSLVASSLNLSSADTSNSQFIFTGDGTPASVVNLGQITAADGGAVVLLGGQVSNQGIIRARLGNIALAAGNEITLDFAGDGLLNVQIDQGAARALANNGGLIQADGGSVLMTAQASDALLQTVVNNTGVIEAHTLQQQNGKIMLLGSFNGGSVNVSGTLDASAPEGGNGGFIETSGAIVDLNSDLQVTTASVDGQTGTWLIDPTDLSISYVGANDGTSHLSTQALQNGLASSNVTVQTQATGAQQGNITVVDPIIWASANRLTLDAHNNIAINDYIHAPNGSLTLDAIGSITTGAEGHINVAGFTLAGGSFTQIMATLPTFMADDFTLNGGTFTRATSGDGSGGSPLQITDIYGLQGLDTTRTFNTALVNDIDASGTASWNGGAGFNPIGNSINPYTGSFNGQGFAISSLTINRPGQDNVGLFSYTNNTAALTGIGLQGGSIVGRNNVGGLVGVNNGGAITSSYTTGTVTGGDAVGGAVGRNSKGSISNSYATGTVKGTVASIGGLVGIAHIGTFITNSYATGKVTGNEVVGGLIGFNAGGTITASYATGELSGNNRFGGLVGYNTGVVTASYWDGQTTGMLGVGVGSGAGAFTAVEVNGDWTGADNAYNKATYANLDFTNTWFIAEGSSRPMLRAFLDGDNIANLYQLQGMSADLAGTYTLTQHIDASATATSVTAGNGGDYSDIWGGRGFAPVGVGGSAFTGSLDGQDFVIDSLTINRANQTGVGLIGYMGSTATISDLGLTNVDITGASRVGSFIGSGSSAGTYFLSNVYAQGEVNGNGQYTGGLAGYLFTAAISDSYAAVDVTSTGNDTGGLAGYFRGHSIYRSYSTGSVQGVQNVGGLTGYINDVIIYDSYSTGAVHASGTDGGGLVGYGTVATVLRSWASGAVTGSGSLGGLVGDSSSIDFDVITSYWDSFTTGQATSAGGGTAVSGNWAAAENAYNQATYAGFNFGTTWFIAEGSSRPMLRSFLSGGGNINNLYDLQGMAAGLGGSYTLLNNIDASATAASVTAGNGGNYADTWGGRGFAPVGYAGTGFSGSLNGNNFAIQNLSMNRSDQSFVGLFGYTSTTAILTSIGLEGGAINGLINVGGLVGYSRGEISSSFATGAVTGNQYVGGLVGQNAGEIANSYATGAVDGVIYVGGLVGQNDGDITSSYATGALNNGHQFTGGLVGWNAGDISSSYATGSVDGFREAGGLVGVNSSTGVITNSYATGAVDGVTRVSALVAVNNNGTITDSFWFIDANPGLSGVGAGSTAGTTGLTTTQFMNPASFTAWGADIDSEGGNGSVWRIYEGNSTPLLRSFLTPITVIAYGDSKTYDGNAYQGLHSINSTTGNGVRYGTNYAQFLAAFGENGTPYGGADKLGTTDLKYAGTALVATNAGSYALTPSGLWSTQQAYDIVTTNGALTIDPASVNITVSVDDANKIYGNSDPVFSWGITSGTLFGGDTLTGTLSRDAGENVGDYTIYGTLDGDLASGNYLVTVNNGVFTVNPRPISIGVTDASKVYGGLDPTFSWGVTSGSMAFGDIATADLTRVADENVGNYAITPSASGALASGNYTVTIDNGSLTIGPRAITLGVADASKIYGELDPTFGWELTSGSMAFGETATADLTRAAGENVGNYAITPTASGALASGNYTLTLNNGSLTVNPRPIAIGVTDASKIYGELDPTFSWGVTSGSMAFGETATADLTRAAGENVGNYAITPTASGALASGNYTLTLNNGSLTVNPRPIAIGVTDASKIYGELDPTFSWGVTSGSMAFGETATADLTRAAGENVGNYAITPTASGALASGNYTLALNNGALSITPRAIVIDIANLDKTYGDADPSFTWAVTGGSLAGHDELSGVISRVAGENVGNYATSGVLNGDLANGNYSYTINNGQLTINQRPLVLTADSLMKIYGAEDPELTWRITDGSLVNDDTLVVNISRADGSSLGSYAITLDGNGDPANNNYALTTVNGQLQINPAPLASNYVDALTSTQLPARKALGRELRANIYEGRPLLNGREDSIVLQVLDGGVKLESNTLTELGLHYPESVRFPVSSSTVGQHYFTGLRTLVEQLQHHPDMHILVQGRAGSTSLSQVLSNQRVQALAAVFISMGLEAERIRTENVDDPRPIATYDVKARHSRISALR